MKYFILIFSILFTGDLWAGATGGTGTSGMILDAKTLMQIYESANNISREALGVEHMFRLDLKNRVVTFDAEREFLKESTTMTFEEVTKYGEEPE